jgi:hypothetical protein
VDNWGVVDNQPGQDAAAALLVVLEDEEDDDEDEEAGLVLEALELVLDSDFLASEEPFDSLEAEFVDGLSVLLAATVLGDLPSERASLR